MRLAVAVMLLTALGACAEVTTFRRADGSVYHHVNCGDAMKLESCSHAAERTCPNGYVRAPVTAAPTHDDPSARCAAANQARRENGEPLQACPPSRARDAYFVCK
jgi:hypothetical protein